MTKIVSSLSLSLSPNPRLKTELESQLLRLHFNQNDGFWNTLPHFNFSVYKITGSMKGFSPSLSDKRSHEVLLWLVSCCSGQRM
jgi:hypothetical protein